MSSSWATFMMGAPVPTSSPTLGNISVTSPSADAVRYVSLTYEFTSATAPSAWRTLAAVINLSSRCAPFFAIVY